MSNTSTQRPRHSRTDDPDEFEPNSLPVEPDAVPEPTHIPDDPELDALVNPED